MRIIYQACFCVEAERSPGSCHVTFTAQRKNFTASTLTVSLFIYHENAMINLRAGGEN